MLGYGPNELIGRHAGVVLDPAEIRRAHAVTEAFGAAGTSWPGLSVSARHRNGTSLWLQTTVRPRQDADGTIRRIDGIARMVGPDTDSIRARQRITARIEAALADRSVRTAFQPIVALAANAVIGVEALSRFGGGPTIGDDRWFADAASVGLGTELELLAVQRALTTAQLLPEHLYVSVNASPATCLDPALTELITCGPIDPARVVLELTEHDAVTDYDALAAALKTLRGRAVRLAVDDAGSGFASFQHILRLRPDVIKLDRCIVSGVDTSPAGRALSAAVVSFAERIGAGVLGEGIQTQAELSAVTELGMHAGQGFFLGRPSLRPADWARWRPGSKATRQVLSAVAGSQRGHTLATAATPVPTLSPVPAVSLVPTAPPIRGPAAPGAPVGQVACSASGVTTVDGADAATRAAFEVLPYPTVILDRTGAIIAVNRAWRMFTLDNAGQPAATGAGVSYVDVCARAAASGSSDAAAVLAGLRAVLTGQITESTRDYSCDSPTVNRWFTATINPLAGGGAVVSHINITRRRRAELEIGQHAGHDPLTGMANRALFTRRLATAVAGPPTHGGRPGVGVLRIELRGVPQVRARVGAAAGDELLLTAAHRVGQLVGRDDTAARLADTTFAICATPTTDNELSALAGRVAAALAEPVMICGHPVRVDAGIGTYLTVPTDTADQSLQAADQILYAAAHPTSPTGRQPGRDQG